MTPVEVDALVRGASPDAVLSVDASTQPTVQAVRLALGSESIRTAVASPRIKLPDVPRESPPTSGIDAVPRPGAPTASGGTALSERGARRPRETLRTEAIRPPTRKR